MTHSKKKTRSRPTKKTPKPGANACTSKPVSGADEVDLFFAKHAAARHLALYVETGDGLLIWRAYAEYRKAGARVPENILAKFDQFERRLAKATGANAVAKALEMAVAKGGAAGAARTVRAEKIRDIVERVSMLITHGPKRSKNDIYAEVAKTFGYGAESVKKLWLSAVKKRT